MNDNVIHANFNRIVTAAPANRRYVMGYQSPLPAAWPSWVIANPEYREKCTALIKDGWKIIPVARDLFDCTHPDVQSSHRLGLEAAWRTNQRMKSSRGQDGAA